MEEWKEYKIEEIISEISMGPFGSDVKKEVYTSFGVPILNGANLQGFKLKEDSFGYVSEEKANSLKKCNAHRGDVVVTHRGTLGQIVYIPDNSKFDRYVISQSQFRDTCNNDIVRPDFLVCLFHTKEGQHKILSNASQVGVPALARATTTFRQIKVKIPSLNVQNRIMNILSPLDDKIEVNRRINEQLEELAQALFKSWFVDFEPFKDSEFVESELGMIPKGWKVCELSEIGDIVGGATPSKANPDYYTEKGISWITPKDLSINKNKFIDKGETDITELGYSKCSAKLMPKGTVLFSSRAPIGYIAIAKKELCTNQGFKSIVPKVAGTAFIYFYLKNNVSNIESMASGSTFKEASGSLMKSLKVIVPPNDLLQKFEEKVPSIFDKQEALEEEITHLTALRDTLLPKLMSGEIDVTTNL